MIGTPPSFRTADYFDLLWTIRCKIITLYNYHSMLMGCNSCCKIFKKKAFLSGGPPSIPLAYTRELVIIFVMSCLGAMSVFFGKRVF